MAVRLSNLSPATYEPLLPAPSVHDDCVIPFNPTNRGLEDGPLTVVSNYRGHSLYLENGALVYRINPKTPGGNGCVSIPQGPSEPEECYIRYNGEGWCGTLEFDN